MRHLTATPLALCAFGLVACPSVEPPGTSLGVFDVRGALTVNSCGDNGLPAEDPLSFQVELRRQTESTATWILDAPPGTSGKLDAQGQFEFVSTSSYVAIAPSVDNRDDDPSDFWNGNASLGPVQHPGCVLEIEERVRGTVTGHSDDAGPGQAELTAVNTITVTPSLGSDCEQALSVKGGPFATLPCKASYDLSGAMSED